jgi:hypothetical protein
MRATSSIVRVLAQAVKFGHLQVHEALSKRLSEQDRRALRRALDLPEE